MKRKGVGGRKTDDSLEKSETLGEWKESFFSDLCLHYSVQGFLNSEQLFISIRLDAKRSDLFVIYQFYL